MKRLAIYVVLSYLAFFSQANGQSGSILTAAAAAPQFIQQGPKLVGNGAVSNPNSGPGGTNQGCSVAVSADGNTALVGGYGDNDGVGAAWVFARNGGGNWSQQGRGGSYRHRRAGRRQ